MNPIVTNSSVFRLESPFDSRGVYTTDLYRFMRHNKNYEEIYDTQSDLFQDHSYSKGTHPDLFSDINVERYTANYLYAACPSIEALKAWFGKYYDAFLKFGFILVEYKVKKYILSTSGMQCAFNRKKDTIERIVIENGVGYKTRYTKKRITYLYKMKAEVESSIN